jgi:hypothetical protein
MFSSGIYGIRLGRKGGTLTLKERFGSIVQNITPINCYTIQLSCYITRKPGVLTAHSDLHSGQALYPGRTIVELSSFTGNLSTSFYRFICSSYIHNCIITLHN